MTQREFIEMAMTFAKENADFQEKGKAMLTALDRKKMSGSGEKSPSKESVINGVVKDAILEILAGAEKPMAIKDIIAELPTEVAYKDEMVAQTYSSSRVSGLLVQLRKAKLVVRTYDKKTAVFALGSEVDAE